MKIGLRVALLSALLLVSVGGIVSVGFISVWRTRAALAEERFERVSAETLLAGRVLGALVPPGTEPAALAPRLDDDGEQLRAALSARGVTLLLAETAAPIWPADAPRLETDALGVSSATMGMAPVARTLPGYEPGTEVVLYTTLAGGDRRYVVRVTSSIASTIDEVLSRARRSVIILGILDGLVLLTAAAWMLRTAVVRPVRELERAAGRVARGDLAATPAVRGVGELATLADAFDTMTRSLRDGRESLIRSEKLAGVGRLAAGVAHEVGNPLAAILGYTEMLLSDSDARPITPELRRDLLERVRSETNRINRIIHELLDYARVPQVTSAPIELARVVDGALSLVKAQTRFRELDVQVDVPASLPAARGDASRLTQVLVNLLINAGDALAGSGRITVRGGAAAGRVSLTVADDGPGIPADLRDKIFDPFFTTKDPGAGTGLGLSVSLAIVEGMGGVLRLGTPARGAEFVIELPQAE